MSCTGPLAFPILGTPSSYLSPAHPKLPVCAMAYKLFLYHPVRSARDLKIGARNISQAKTTEGRSYPRTQSEHGARARTLVQETRILDSPPKTVVGRPVVSMLRSFPSHNRSSPHSPKGRQWASSRTPLLLVAVGRSAQFPVPCRMFKVSSGVPPAPACSPLALTFLHRRRLRLLDPSLSLFEAGAPPAPAAPEGPAPGADSINSPGSRCRDQFQPPGSSPRANPGYILPPGPHATQSWACSSSGPAP